MSKTTSIAHEEEMRHGSEARADWDSYHSAIATPDPRYHNRPSCPEGAAIDDDSLRMGTDGRTLCDGCRQAEHAAG